MTRKLKLSQQDQANSQSNKNDVPIVAIGASAGGLEALGEFFDALPADSGMAFVVVQHLAPEHQSSLPQILAKHTKLHVVSVTDKMPVEKATLHVIPPGFTATISGSRFHLEKVVDHVFRYPIDLLFTSIAEDVGPVVVGIILSGTGTDGTLGLKAIKAAAGLTLVQDPVTARFDGMPSSAAPYADMVLPVSRMPQQLQAFLHLTTNGEEDINVKKTDGDFSRILYLLQSHTGFDFSTYKTGTLQRRIERRMVANHATSLSEYAAILSQQPDEAANLLQDILINVTSFFRDPEAFSVLTEQFTDYISENIADNTLRVWVIGCSTGEEPYSVAILINEIQEKLRKFIPVQIFATDIDRKAVDAARHGLYLENIRSHISDERLNRYFKHQGTTFRIEQSIRDRIVFASHDVLTDPPFTHLDLICCRNLLIYLNPSIQKKLYALMHYALNPGGLLFLGQSETTGGGNLFAAIDHKQKVYKKLNVPSPAHLAPPFNAINNKKVSISATENPPVVRAKNLNFTEIAKRIIAEEYTPAYVIIDGNNNVLYVSGDTSKYLRLATGETQWNILDLAADDFRPRLVSIIYEIRSQTGGTSTSGPFGIRQGGIEWLVSVEARKTSADSQELLLILRDLGKKPQKRRPQVAKHGETEDSEAATLKHELKLVQDNLHANVAELASSNEDLKVTNEELQSSNEELQSTNEELETSREELRSLNEELLSVNSEERTHVEELTRASDDLRNLLDNTDIAAIFLDRELKIKSFTRPAVALIPMINTDVGRPLKDIRSKLEYDNLIDDAATVLHSLRPMEKSVQSKDGQWIQVRMRPYRTTDNAVAGITITFFDINENILSRVAIKYAKSVVDTVRAAMTVLDSDLRLVSANKAFYKLFDVTPGETMGKPIAEIGRGELEVPELQNALKSVLNKGTKFDDFAVTLKAGTTGKKQFLLNARRLVDNTSDPMALLSIEAVDN